MDIQSTKQTDDAYEKLKQLEADHGPIDGIGMTNTFALLHTSGCSLLLVLLVSSGGLLHRIKPIGQEFCKCFPQLRFLTGGGAGFDNINTAALSESGVYYCNTPQAVAEPTADAASIMILSTLRNIISYDRNTRKGKWKEGLALGTNPRDAT